MVQGGYSQGGGGLCIGSLASANKALMVKWSIRYKNEYSALWVKLITAWHCGTRCHSHIPLKSSMGRVWKSIVNVGRATHNPVVNIKDRLIPKVGVGDKTLFWLDSWIGNRPLRDIFPSLYALETDKRCKVQLRYSSIHGTIEWFWGSSIALSRSDHLTDWAACTSLLHTVALGPGTDLWL
ncbi:hypothetical protein HanIR_Chr15g0739541 [Helianthus annuus]|nr:hypothetical protein HanIR_Chr15g0739541 [Helianthus annuus]